MFRVLVAFMATATFVLALLLLYVGSYFGLGELGSCNCRNGDEMWLEKRRYFPFKLEDSLFWPLHEWETAQYGRLPEPDPKQWIEFDKMMERHEEEQRRKYGSSEDTQSVSN